MSQSPIDVIVLDSSILRVGLAKGMLEYAKLLEQVNGDRIVVVFPPTPQTEQCCRDISKEEYEKYAYVPESRSENPDDSMVRFVQDIIDRKEFPGRDVHLYVGVKDDTFKKRLNFPGEFDEGLSVDILPEPEFLNRIKKNTGGLQSIFKFHAGWDNPENPLGQEMAAFAKAAEENFPDTPKERATVTSCEQPEKKKERDS